MVAALGVAVLVLGGCQNDTPANRPTPAPTVSAPPQDPRAEAEQAALTAYRGMWSAYAKAGLTSNPDEPDLARYATDRALKTLKDGLSSNRSKGYVIKGEYGSSPQLAEVGPGAIPASVVVTDCLDGTKFLVYRTSGELVKEPSGRRATRATVAKTGSDWKVTGFGVQAVGTC